VPFSLASAARHYPCGFSLSVVISFFLWLDWRPWGIRRKHLHRPGDFFFFSQILEIV
jgi:hypothetical protein